MVTRLLTLVLTVFWSSPVFAQTVTPTFAQAAQTPSFAQSSPPFLPAQSASNLDQILSLIAERDKQYAQRFEAQEKALAFAVTNVNQKFEALEKAIAIRFEQQEKSTTVALSAAEKAVQAALVAAKEAVAKAESAAEKRFESVNEFRNTLKDQQLLLQTRTEASSTANALDRRISEVASKVNEISNKAEGASNLWAYLVGGGGFFVALAALLFAVSKRPAVVK